MGAPMGNRLKRGFFLCSRFLMSYSWYDINMKGGFYTPVSCNNLKIKKTFLTVFSKGMDRTASSTIYMFSWKKSVYIAGIGR